VLISPPWHDIGDCNKDDEAGRTINNEKGFRRKPEAFVLSLVEAKRFELSLCALSHIFTRHH
jgi:hypothetical protein